MTPRLSRVVTSPLVPLAAGVAFMVTVALLPVSDWSPSFAGRGIKRALDDLRGYGRATHCVMPYYQKWYTLSGGKFVEANDDLVRAASPGAPLALASIDTYPSGPSGLWAPTAEIQTIRVTVDGTQLTNAHIYTLRGQ